MRSRALRTLRQERIRGVTRFAVAPEAGQRQSEAEAAVEIARVVSQRLLEEQLGAPRIAAGEQREHPQASPPLLFRDVTRRRLLGELDLLRGNLHLGQREMT